MKAGFLKELAGRLFFLSSLAFFLFTLAGLLLGQKPAGLFGLRPVYILSGSMEPAISCHALILTKDLKGTDPLSPGEIITFLPAGEESQLVTHRIIKIGEDGLIYTKGDANACLDPRPVDRSRVMSRCVLILNGFANLSALLNGPPKFLLLLSLPLFLLSLLLFLSLYREKKRQGLNDS